MTDHPPPPADGDRPPSPAERYAAARGRGASRLIGDLEALTGFALDPFQRQASRALEEGASVLVCAPTGAGKSVVGQAAVLQALQAGKRCFYTTPIKALSNQKFHEFIDQHGQRQVGLLTGDTSVNGSAPIVVMTTEVLRNMLYALSPDLDDLSAVVLDEVHYLADRARGAVWEEIILHLPPQIRIVGLSATVSNAEEFGDWLRTIRGHTEVIVSEHRPVPLWQHMMVGRELFDLYEPGRGQRVNRALLRAVEDMEQRLARTAQRDAPRPTTRQRHRHAAYRQDRVRWRPPRRASVVRRLRRDHLLPVIVFIFSRAGCDAAVRQCIHADLTLTSPAEREAIDEIIDRHCSGLAREDLAVLDFWGWRDGMLRGISAHHAGLLPAFKEAAEEAFTAGLLQVIFATETLALGINMPARSVLLERLVKFDGESHQMLTAGEYTQLTGRAGRRGIDEEGHATVLWAPGIDPSTVAGLAGTRTYPLYSSFRTSYNMAINLLDRWDREAASRLIERSFAQFQTDRVLVEWHQQLQQLRRRADGVRTEVSCDRGEVTEYLRIHADLSEMEKQRPRRRGGDDKARRASIERLRRDLRQHPVHGCPDRNRHVRQGRRLTALDHQAAALRRRIDTASSSLVQDLERHWSLLHERGYLLDDAPTEVGQSLTHIWSESDLLITECLRYGTWDELDPADLAGAVSGVVFEARRDGSGRVALGGPLGAAARACEGLWQDLADAEQRWGITPGRHPDHSCAAAMAVWARGSTLAEALEVAAAAGLELAAGDFVRLCRQVVDVLDQIARAGPDTVRPGARTAVGLVRRDVVAMGM